MVGHRYDHSVKILKIFQLAVTIFQVCVALFCGFEAVKHCITHSYVTALLELCIALFQCFGVWASFRITQPAQVVRFCVAVISEENDDLVVQRELGIRDDAYRCLGIVVLEDDEWYKMDPLTLYRRPKATGWRFRNFRHRARRYRVDVDIDKEVWVSSGHDGWGVSTRQFEVMLNWIAEETVHKWSVTYGAVEPPSFAFSFSKLTDATAFKLRFS